MICHYVHYVHLDSFKTKLTFYYFLFFLYHFFFFVLEEILLKKGYFVQTFTFASAILSKDKKLF